MEREHNLQELLALVNNHDEYVAVTVISNLLDCLAEGEGFFSMAMKHGGPAQILLHLMTKHCLCYDEIVQCFESLAAPTAATI